MAAQGEVCIANISLQERRKRLMAGVLNLLLAAGGLAVLIFFGAGRWWRLALFVPLYLAASGVFQWRDKT
jgi:hypothetical protein